MSTALIWDEGSKVQTGDLFYLSLVSPALDIDSVFFPKQNADSMHSHLSWLASEGTLTIFISWQQIIKVI